LSEKKKIKVNLYIYIRFIGEEMTAAGHKYELTNDPTWIIDPIGEYKLFPNEY